MARFWNGKPLGIPYAFVILGRAIFHNLGYKLSSFFYGSNIKKCGKGTVIMPGFRYRFPKTIEIGEGVIISNNVELSRGEIETGCIIIEDGASIDKSCFIDYSGGLIIRKNAHIAWNVYISTHDHGYDYHNPPVGKPLEIGENAFIGAKSIILHNCNYIGRNAVVGTGSVVTKDVPDYAIVAGNPAKIIKQLNQPDKDRISD